MRKIYLLASLITFFSCSSEKENSQHKISDIEVTAINDTTLVVKKQNIIDTVIIDLGPNFAFDWKDVKEFTKRFNDFYINSKTDSAFGNQIKEIDITGDGKEEKVVSLIKEFGDSLIYFNYILEKNDTIWHDTLVLNREYAIYKFGSEKLFKLLKPYSFKLLLKERTDFIQDYEYNLTIKALQPTFLKNVRPADTLFWKKELKTYKGKIVHNVYLESGADSYLWDKKNNKLVQIYSE